MSSNGLEQCLYDIGCSGKARRTYSEQPEEFLGRYALDEEERRLVAQEEVAELFRRGLNPMLLMGFYMGLHGPRSMPEYLGKMPTLQSHLEAAS
jgi:protocatechuate 4,5-dioxygenase alpha chain